MGLEGGLVLGLNGAQPELAAIGEWHLLLQFPGVGPDGQALAGPGTRTGSQADAGVQRQDAVGIRQQGIDVELDDLGDLHHQGREPHQGQGDRLQIGARQAGPAAQAGMDPGLLQHRHGQAQIERGETQGPVPQHLRATATLTDQQHGAKLRVFAEAEDQLARRRPARHGLDRKAVQARLGVRLADPVEHGQGGGLYRLRTRQFQGHAARAAFMRDIR